MPTLFPESVPLPQAQQRISGCPLQLSTTGVHGSVLFTKCKAVMTDALPLSRLLGSYLVLFYI